MENVIVEVNGEKHKIVSYNNRDICDTCSLEKCCDSELGFPCESLSILSGEKSYVHFEKVVE